MVIPKKAKDVLVVSHISRHQKGSTFFHGGRQFAEDAGPCLAGSVPSLHGLACDWADWRVVVVKVELALSRLGQTLSSAMTNELMNDSSVEADGVGGASPGSDTVPLLSELGAAAESLQRHRHLSFIPGSQERRREGTAL